MPVYPSKICCSNRYIFNQLNESLAGVPKERMVDWWLKNYVSSPYVPDTERERISHAIKKGNNTEPNLMKLLRKAAPKLRTNSK